MSVSVLSTARTGAVRSVSEDPGGLPAGGAAAAGTAQPDRTPNLRAGGRGPAPHQLSPADHAIAIVDYRWERNAAARRAHARRQQRYCAYLFRQLEVLLHY
jgi:hypothetical protein